MSATETMMKGLHLKLAQKMEKILESDDVTAATLNTIRSFLSDNEITCEIEANDQMKNLRDKLKERKDNIAKKKLSPGELEEVSNVVQFHAGNGDSK